MPNTSWNTQPTKPRRASGRTAASELRDLADGCGAEGLELRDRPLDRLAVVLGSGLGADADHLLHPRNEPGAAADLPAHARSARGGCGR